MICTSSVPRICGERAKRYQRKKDSIDTLTAKIANHEKRLQNAKSKLEQTKDKIIRTERASKLPILISMTTDTIKTHGLCCLDAERTHYVYYLLDLDTVIDYAWRGENSKNHLMKGTCDLTSIVSSNRLTTDTAVAKVKRAATELIRQHEPKTWVQLRKLLIKHFLEPSDN
ncbi:hypothetical protein IK146_00360 [Candidatus Saccharibacteria bacterium]|nr:hypothetical protein [Candidatus Saccharibacteria bacterium]